MKSLCYNDICNVMIALRSQAEHQKNLADALPDGTTKENVLRDREETLRLRDYFRDIAERLLDIDLGQSIRITAKFNRDNVKL